MDQLLKTQAATFSSEQPYLTLVKSVLLERCLPDLGGFSGALSRVAMAGETKGTGSKSLLTNKRWARFSIGSFHLQLNPKVKVI